MPSYKHVSDENERARQRLLAYTQPGPGDCWLWVGRLSPKGYGEFSYLSRCTRAHRTAYLLFVGPIPDGLQLDHLCRVRHCVNPGHLEPVTCRENLLRSPETLATRQLARTSCPRGHGYTPENTRVRPDGRRECRTCARALRKRAAR